MFVLGTFSSIIRLKVANLCRSTNIYGKQFRQTIYLLTIRDITHIILVMKTRSTKAMFLDLKSTATNSNNFARKSSPIIKKGL